MYGSITRPAAGAALATALLFGFGVAPAFASPAGPHLDGNAYDALRSPNPVPTLTFEINAELKGDSARHRVTLGPDFVIEEEARNSIRIYDFRFHRALGIDTNSGYFTNESLYAHFRARWALFENNIFAIKLLQEMEEKSDLPLALERFLIEHRTGIEGVQKIYKDPPPAPSMDINLQDMEMIVNVEGTEILRAIFGPFKFPSAAHREVFAAWLIWQIHIHPKIVRAIIEPGTLPAQMQILRQDFAESKFPVLNLAFNRVSRSRGRLDVLSGLTPDTPDSPHMPKKLARLMIDAARGQAPNHPPDDSGYIQNIRKLMSEGNYLDAVLLGFHASFQYEGCAFEHQEKPLCKTVIETHRKAIGKDDSVQKLIQAMHLMGEKKHEQVVEMLSPFRSEVRFRPDILEFFIANEIIEARRAAERTAAGTQDATQRAALRTAALELYKDEFDRLPDTFTTALAADPYAPVRYRDISNYFSVGARGIDAIYDAFILEHFVLDLARALPGQAIPSIIQHTTDAEARMAAEFPMLFPRTTEIAE